MSTTASIPPTERTLAYVYDSAYAGFPNWEIGRPQWAFVDLVIRSDDVVWNILDFECIP